MIKPDYIPFSQEIFDDLEEMRARVIANRAYSRTPEFAKWSFEHAEYVFTDEYGRHMKEQMAPK